MNLKKFFLAGAALSVALTSCNKSDDLVGGGDEANEPLISLSLMIESDALTKAIGGDVKDEHPVAFDGGRVYFTNQGKHILNYFEIGPTTVMKTVDIDDGTGTNTTVPTSVVDTVGVDDLRDGKTLVYAVKESVLYDGEVYVFGNIPGITLPISGHIDIARGYTASVTSQMDANGGVEAAYLYGTAPIEAYGSSPGTGTPGVPAAKAYAEVTVAPITTRLELAQVEGLADPATGITPTITLAGYEIEGLFFNYFHGTGTLGGTPVSSSFVSYTSLDDFEMHTGLGSTPWYNQLYRGYTFDYDAINGITTPVSGSMTYTPETANHTLPSTSDYMVWGYNMFAAETLVPHLILKFRNVQVSIGGGAAQPLNDPAVASLLGLPAQEFYYITIKRYQNAGTPLTAFAGGHVYTIENLQFSINNLKEVPEWEDDILADVTIKVADWKKVIVNADID